MSEKPIKPLSSLPAKPKPKQSLTFNDGLNFGMGFFVAGFLFFVCVMPIMLGVLYIFLQSLGETLSKFD